MIAFLLIRSMQWNWISRWFDEATCSFPFYSKETVGEEHLFLSRLFWTSFKSEIACNGWKMVELQRKWNPLILWSKEKAVWIPENETAIVPDINDHLAAVHDRKVYIGEVFEIDDSNAKISLHEYAGTLSIGSTFCEPKMRVEIWVEFVNILYVVPVSAETKRGKKFEKFLLQNVMEKFPVWKNKNWPFFLFFTVLGIQCDFFYLLNDYQFRNYNIHYAIEFI